MSIASQVFAHSISDAENLLAHFNALNTLPPPPELEVLKRAGIIMAMTAWETFVEDRLEEACSERLSTLTDRSIASFVEQKLHEEIKRLHNPNSQKTRELLLAYADIDVRNCWFWQNCDFTDVCQRLDHYIALRGDVVHRSLPPIGEHPRPHPVKKNELAKAIGFLKNLVAATERGFDLHATAANEATLESSAQA